MNCSIFDRKDIFYRMEQLHNEEIFSAPRWQKIVYKSMSLLVVATGAVVLTLKDAGWIVFLAPLLFLIAVSMFIHTRLKLIISNRGIRFVGGIKQHHILWGDVKKVDMVRLGKYKTPITSVYYSGGTLQLHRSLYLPLKFNRILSLLEMKIDSGLFTEKYKDIRREIS